MVTPIVFDKAFVEELESGSEFERWFLEAVYHIAEKPLFVNWPDQLVYSPGENIPSMTIFGSANILIGDWRPGFLEAGSPLVFVTTFKLLDMLFDAILMQNGFGKTFRFQHKIEKIKAGLIYPDFIESRDWLKERVIGFYENLEPLRGTIIHDKHFDSSYGNLKVSSSKKGIVGPEQIIERGELRSLSILAISVIHYVKGSWISNSIREKTLRRECDKLSRLHRLPLLGQLEPRKITVRVYRQDDLRVSINFTTIKEEIRVRCVNQDVEFDLRIIVSKNEDSVVSFLLPWEIVTKYNSEAEFEKEYLNAFVGETPADVDPREIYLRLHQ